MSLQYDEISSPRLQDGKEANPGDRIRHDGQEVTYMGASRLEWTKIVVANDEGDLHLAHPIDCHTA